MNYPDAGLAEINAVMLASKKAFESYRKTSAENRAVFLETIASNMEQLGDALILKASEETNLPPARLLGERGRTTMQLRLFAEMLREGSWVEASIDTAIPSRQPLPKPDLRKMLIPVGPVVVFGASNFPFAYSTAGGDTASALAVGCTVVVKAHQAHAETSEMVYKAIRQAMETCNMPPGTFQHVHGAGFETGKALVQHEATAAVGFTGSFTGGRALYDYAAGRKTPIPVFSEMGSVNPVIVLPEALREKRDELVNEYTASITTGMGQFCTKPGLLFAIDNAESENFITMLGKKVESVTPAGMLHPGINKAYVERSARAMSQPGVITDNHQAQTLMEKNKKAIPAIASVTGNTFLENPFLHEEVFGPFALLVKCKDLQQLKQAWQSVSGQLTTTIIGTDEELKSNSDLLDAAAQIAGRVVFNGVPTGVEVCPSMVHGGPYPATTDGRFTAVGLGAAKRWVRPVCYQNCPDFLLPDELKNENPKNMQRLVNNQWTSDAI